MTIDEVANMLNDCGNKKRCDICKFGFGIPTEDCRAKIIIAMGNECRKIVEESEDDGK